MSTFRRLGSALALLIFVAALPAMSQLIGRPTSSSPTTGGRPTSTTSSQRGKRDNCLKKAGVSKQAMEEHRQIEENARTRMSEVCNDSSLSQQEKRKRIEGIRQEAKQQSERLLSSQQRQAVEACHHGGGGGRGGGGGGRGAGPCGEL